MLNNNINYKFIHKNLRFASYDIICMSYVTKSTLMKQMYLSFDPLYFNKCLIFSNHIPKYLSTHIKYNFQVLSSEFKIQNQLPNGN